MEYGLIGARLGHSYSKIIHEMLCGYKYDLCPLPTEEEARAFLTKRQFRAINVTIPYKKLVMEYCSYIDPRAKAIGAVNTVVNKNGLLYGYNTDYLGFAHLCDAHGVDFAGRTVLILGTGGTHNTTSAVARDKGAAKVLTVSRHPDPETGELSYAEAVRSGAQIVINTTPAGMYPNVGVCNLDVAAMPGLEAVVDVVYNPDKTELILRAEEAGVPVAVGGLEMLVAQAVYAAEYFLDRKFEDAPAEIRRITAALRRDTLNIALIGMPSSGKTTLGKLLAKQLGRTFVDLDDAIVKADGRSIPDIFAAEGEDGFRTKETAETQRFGKEGRQLISCGGGIVKKPENLRALHQNGVILFIDRPVDALAVGGGSVIDTAKAIALGMVYGDDFWKIFQKKLVPTQMAPVGTIHTISATGSETSRSSVIKDDLDTQHKFGFMLDPCRPVFALMNPEWTMTLPAYQMAAGASDIFAHTVERYFAEGDCYLGDKFCEGLLRSVIKYAPIAINDPKNYDAHAELMLAGSFSHNDTTGLGRLGMDGSCHGLETQVSGLFDTAHGAGLAVIMPAWMEFMIDTQEDIHQFVKFATNVFDVEYDMQDPKGVALEGVKRFRAWLKEIGMPLTFKELGVKKEDMQKLLDHTCKKDGSVGHHIPLYYDDVKRIFDSVVE